MKYRLPQNKIALVLFNKKLKIIELQMKKLKLDQDTGSDANLPTAQGHVLDRNELLTRLLNRDSADTPKS